MGLIGGAAMLALSVLYFNDLGLKKVLIFNAIYLGCFFLPVFGFSGWVAVVGQFVTLGGLFVTARSA